MDQGPIAFKDAEAQPPPRDAATPEALERLRTRLIRYAVKLVWNREDAEETVQEAFKIALSSSRSPASVTEAFEPWMFRTVGNLCLNLRRKRRPEPLADWMDPGHEVTPEIHSQRAEELARLRAAISQLPQQQRIALVLRTMEQMAFAEIADIMAITTPAVRTHVHLARRKLAELLGGAASEDQS